MAATADNEHSGGPLLESFSKNNPPGWRPGDAKYPFPPVRAVITTVVQSHRLAHRLRRTFNGRPITGRSISTRLGITGSAMPWPDFIGHFGIGC